MLFWLIPARHRLKYVLVVWSIALGVFAAIYLGKASAVGDMPRVALYGFGILVAGAMAILSRPPIFAAGLCVVGGLFGYDFYLKSLEAAALRPVVRAAAAVVQSSARLSIMAPAADGPSVPGKFLVWDMGKDRLADAHYKLPASLRATAQDQAITLFLLWNVESRQVTTYHKVGEAVQPGAGSQWAGYQDTAHLAVVTWPGPRLLGWHSVVGEKPAHKIPLHWGVAYNSDLHGDLTQPIAQWIRFLPGVPASPPPAPLSFVAFAPPAAASPSASTSAPPAFPSTASSAPPSTAAWTEATAQKEAMRRYPQLAVPQSPLNRAYLARYQQIKATNPSYLRDPAWPLRLADEVAKQTHKP